MNESSFLVIGSNDAESGAEYEFIRYLGVCHPACKECETIGDQNSCLTCQEGLTIKLQSGKKFGTCDKKTNKGSVLITLQSMLILIGLTFMLLRME